MLLIVKNNDGFYLTRTSSKYDLWCKEKEDAFEYTSSLAFDYADKLGGKVFLRTKIREIEVTREDFGFE